MIRSRSYPNVDRFLDAAVLFGLGGDWEFTATYPWTKYYHTGYAPEGGDEAVDKVVSQGIKVLTPILVAGAKAFGATPQQICPTYIPADPTLGDEELAYTQKVGNRALVNEAIKADIGTAPAAAEDIVDQAAGLGVDTSDLAKQAATDAAKQAATQTVMDAVGAGAGAGLATQAVKLVMDPKGAFASESASMATTASLASAAAVAVGAPVVGWAIGAGMAIKALVDFRQSAAAAKREEHRWDELVKSIKSASKILVDDAQSMANNLIARGVAIPQEGDPSALLEHYKQQQRNYAFKKLGYKAVKEKLAYYQSKPPDLMKKLEADRAAWHAKWWPVFDQIAKEYMDRHNAQINKLIAAETKYPARRASLQRQILTLEQTKKLPEIYARRFEARAKAGVSKDGPKTYEEWIDKLNDDIKSITKNANRIGRQASVRILLQAARDCRIINSLLAGKPVVIPAAPLGKVAAQVMQQNPKLVSKPATEVVTGAAQAMAAEAAKQPAIAPKPVAPPAPSPAPIPAPAPAPAAADAAGGGAGGVVAVGGAIALLALMSK